MTTRKPLSVGLIAALLVSGSWGVVQVRAQDEKPERRDGAPGIADPNDRDPHRIDDRGPGDPANFGPDVPKGGGAPPGGPRDPSASRDPTDPRGPRGPRGGGMPGFRGPFAPFGGMPANDPEMEKLMRTDVEL